MIILIQYKGIDFDVEFTIDEAEEFYDMSVDITSVLHYGDEFYDLVDIEAIELLIIDKLEL